MKITKEDVFKISALARIELSAEAQEKLSRELESILDYVDELKAVDTGKIRPTSHSQEMKNVMREDLSFISETREGIMKNAPAEEDGYFVVKKVIE